MAGKSSLDMHPFLDYLMRVVFECDDLKAMERRTGISYNVLREWGFYDGFKKTAFEHVDQLHRQSGFSHAQIRDGFTGAFKPWLEPARVG
jgi:hypothetical protein